MTNTPEDNIVLLILIIVAFGVMLCVIMMAIISEKNHSIYKIIYKDNNDGQWKTHKAGLSFVDAHSEMESLRKAQGDEVFYHIAHDTFVGE